MYNPNLKLIMTNAERCAICKMCTKRSFTPEQGIVCSLTGAKPTFEGECPEYAVDESQVQLAKVLEQNVERAVDERINGWLAFFLWVGVGFGATISFFSILTAMFAEQFGWIVTSCQFVLITAIVLVAVLTIVGFYRRWSNAVALAKTYIALIFMDGLLSAVIGFVLEDGSMAFGTIRSFVWSAVWFTYLLCSAKVEGRIPSESRRWRGLEKTILSVAASIYLYLGIAFYMAFGAGNFTLLSGSLENFIQASLDNAIGEQVDYNTYISNAYLDNEEIVFEYTTSDDFWYYEIDEEAILRALTMEKDVFVDTCFKNGYTITYLLGSESVSITPEEYANAQKVYLH